MWRFRRLALAASSWMFVGSVVTALRPLEATTVGFVVDGGWLVGGIVLVVLTVRAAAHSPLPQDLQLCRRVVLVAAIAAYPSVFNTGYPEWWNSPTAPAWATSIVASIVAVAVAWSLIWVMVRALQEATRMDRENSLPGVGDETSVVPSPRRLIGASLLVVVGEVVVLSIAAAVDLGCSGQSDCGWSMGAWLAFTGFAVPFWVGGALTAARSRSVVPTASAPRPDDSRVQ